MVDRVNISQNGHLASMSLIEAQGGTAVLAAVKDIATVEEYERIFERYLDICNQAIVKNKDKFPYMEIWKAQWKNLGPGNTLQCAVYDDRPKIVYTLQLTEDMKIKIIEKAYVAPEDEGLFKKTSLNIVIKTPHK